VTCSSCNVLVFGPVVLACIFKMSPFYWFLLSYFIHAPTLFFIITVWTVVHTVLTAISQSNGMVKLRPLTDPNPLTDYNKTLHNWLRPRYEHVTQKFVPIGCKGAWQNAWNIRPLLFYFIFSRARLLKSSVDGLWRTIAQNTRCDVSKCLFGVHTMADNILGLNSPKNVKNCLL